MNQNDLADELLKRAAEQGGDDASAKVAAFVIQRDRRRIRLLSGVIVGSWLLAALLIPSVLLPLWAKVDRHMKQYSAHVAEQNPKITPQVQGYVAYESFKGLAVVSTIIAAISTSASLLAAIATVWLVLAVRRSTLNQINIGLAGVTEQLKRLAKTT